MHSILSRLGAKNDTIGAKEVRSDKLKVRPFSHRLVFKEGKVSLLRALFLGGCQIWSARQRSSPCIEWWANFAKLTYPPASQ
jgi:hypothetical protein